MQNNCSRELELDKCDLKCLTWLIIFDFKSPCTMVSLKSLIHGSQIMNDIQQ